MCIYDDINRSGNHYNYLPFVRVIAARDLLVHCLEPQGLREEGVSLLRRELGNVPSDAASVEAYNEILGHGLDVRAVLDG